MQDTWSDFYDSAKWYNDLTDRTAHTTFVYNDSITYKKGYDFLSDCESIEDWGCGSGGFRRFFTNKAAPTYTGIDRSITPYADIRAELANYKSDADGIYIRHVIEFNSSWRPILQNAFTSFRSKMCLVISMQIADKDDEISTSMVNHKLVYGLYVPIVSFKMDDITALLDGYGITYTFESIQLADGVESVFYLTKQTKLSLAFYTCFYGASDNPAFVIQQPPSTKYKCYYFTNNLDMMRQLESTKWIGIHDAYNESEYDSSDQTTSCMRSKRVKVKPHAYPQLCSYNYTCYIDSKISNLNEKFVEDFITYFFIERPQLDLAIILRQHWQIKQSVWEEYDLSMHQDRYKAESDRYVSYINKQIALGLKPVTDTHCACGILIRNMRHPKMTEIDDAWYAHIQECGIQDQISFFFVKQIYESNVLATTGYPFIY